MIIASTKCEGDGTITVAKTFELMEKLYGELVDFRKETRDRFDAVDQRFEGMDKRFEGMDKRFEGMDQKFEGMDQKFEGMDQYNAPICQDRFF